MTISTRQLAGHFGCEITGVDLCKPVDDDLRQQIVNLYNQHSLLLFRQQSLTPKSMADFCHRLGQPKIETRKQFNFREVPEVSTIGNIENATGKPLSFFVRGGFGWHTDGAAACHVDAATLLYAVEVPRDGGDTLFASTTDAWERAPQSLKLALDDVSFLTSFHAHNDPLSESDPESFIPLSDEERSALPPVWHKVIQTHPVTGKTAFYLNTDPLEFRGVDFERGLELMKQALALATEPDRTYRYRWAPGDLIIWDNHAMLHSGTPTLSYESDRRLMLRSFVYTQPTERPLSNYDQLCQIFMPDQHSIQLSDFEH